jgi:hypothetical protein
MIKLFAVSALVLLSACGANDPTAPRSPQIDISARRCAAVGATPVTVVFDTNALSRTEGNRVTRVEWCNTGNVVFTATLTFTKAQFTGDLNQYPLDFIAQARGEGDVVLPTGVSVARSQP